MILKAFKSSQLVPHHLFGCLLPFHRLPPVRTISTTSQTDIPIDKILKTSSSKKCDSPKDAVFCSLIFGMVADNRTMNPKDTLAVQTQITRLVSNSLLYIPELSLSETMLISNQLLRLRSTRKIKIEAELMNQFLVKANRNILTGLNKDKDGKCFNQVLKYLDKLIKDKRPSSFIDDILKVLMEGPVRTDQQVMDILRLLLAMKFKNKLGIQVFIKNFVEEFVGARVQKLPIESVLIDEQVLRFFVNFKLNIKYPYNLYPAWLFKFVQKLKQKYSTQKHKITSTKHITLLTTYTKFLTQQIPITKTSSLCKPDYDFLIEHFLFVSQSFDNIDGESMYDKIKQFCTFLMYFHQFLDCCPDCDNQAVFVGLDEALVKIYHNYYAPRGAPQIMSREQVGVLVGFYMQGWLFLEKYANRKSSFARILPKLYNHLKQQFTTIFNHNKHKPEQVSSIFQLLPYILLFVSRSESFFTSPSSDAVSIIRMCEEWVEGLSQAQIRKLCAGKEKTDAISNIKMAMMYTGYHSSNKFNQVYEMFESKYLTLVIESRSSCILIRYEPFLTDMLRISKQLMQKLRTKPTNSQKYTPQTSSIGYTYNNYEQQLANNLISLLKCDHEKTTRLNSRLFHLWFCENSQIVRSMFLSPNQDFHDYWLILTHNVQYIRHNTLRSGVDLLAEVTRVCYPQQSSHSSLDRDRLMRKVVATFSKSAIYSGIFNKIDKIAEMKYAWMLGLVVKWSLSILGTGKAKSKSQEHIVEVPNIDRLIELISLACQDLKSPIQMNTLSTDIILRTVNKALDSIVEHRNSNKEQAQVLQQPLFQPPIQQILYMTKQHNKSEAPHKWVAQISPPQVHKICNKSYTKLQVYNILLCLDNTTPLFKKVHNYFITQLIKNTSHSPVIQVYRLLHMPHGDQEVDKALRGLQAGERLTGRDLLGVWGMKGVVLGVKDDRILGVLLNQLMELDVELTYAEFSTIVNSLLTLFSQSRLREFSSPNSPLKISLQSYLQQKTLNILRSCSGSFPHKYMVDYLSMVTQDLLVPIPQIQKQVEQAIKNNLQHNNLDIIDMLYLGKIVMTTGNVADFQRFLQECWNRGLFLDYFQLAENCYFRIQLFWIQMWGISLTNHLHHNKFLQWCITSIIQKVDTQGIIDLLYNNKNNKITYQIIQRYRICQNLFNKDNEANIILAKISDMKEQDMQEHISDKQATIFNTAKGSTTTTTSMVSVRGTHLLLVGGGGDGKFVYLLQSARSTVQEEIEFAYLKNILGNNASIEMRSVLE